MSLRRLGIWKIINKRYLNHTQHKSFYEILGLPENATKKDIKDKFYELSKKYHPDMVNGIKGYDDNAKKFREINQAYETLKNDTKRAEYDRSRGYGHSSNSYRHDFSSYQNPNGGYYYRSKTFYYGPKGYGDKSTRYTQAEFEDIWKRFNKQMNSDQQKEYEKYQEYIRTNMWKEYQTRREEAWKKHKEEFNRRENIFYDFNGKNKKSFHFNFDEGTLAKIAAIYIVIFAGVTLFQIVFERSVLHSKDTMKNSDIFKHQYHTEDSYTPLSLKDIPTKVEPQFKEPPVDHSTMPYGMPK
uniref:DnaJ homolog subfamily B member 9 n=1 Tax=Parastrongyloides trichosuri TaxID=131310 RepID=A0A0N4ZQI7_PARTI